MWSVIVLALDGPTPMLTKVMPRAPQIAAGIGIIYLTLSMLCALLYWIGGMNGLEACVHAMSTLATGGFSTADASFGYFNSLFIDVVAITFMLLGGMTYCVDPEVKGPACRDHR